MVGENTTLSSNVEKQRHHECNHHSITNEIFLYKQISSWEIIHHHYRSKQFDDEQICYHQPILPSTRNRCDECEQREEPQHILRREHLIGQDERKEHNSRIDYDVPVTRPSRAFSNCMSGYYKEHEQDDDCDQNIPIGKDNH